MQQHRSFTYFREIFFYLIVVVFTLAFLKTIAPFLIDILLAGILVNFFNKMNTSIARRLHSKRKAALISVTIITLVLALPLFITGVMISAEATNSYEYIKNRWAEYSSLLTDGNIRAKLSSIPIVGRQLSEMNFADYSGKLASFGESVLALLFILLKKTLFNLTSFVVHFCITLFLAYYLFIDSRTLLHRISALLPLKNSEEKKFFSELVKITDAIIINTVLVGVAEGTFGGILFALLGISSPFFWGVIMVLLSMVPVFGANTILLPAAIIQLLMGDYFGGFVLLIIGVGGITINQNIIKPRLDGKRSGLHPAIVFLGSMGGIIWLGMIGFLVGPIIMACFLVTWNIVGEKYGSELLVHKKNEYSQDQNQAYQADERNDSRLQNDDNTAESGQVEK